MLNKITRFVTPLPYKPVLSQIVKLYESGLSKQSAYVLVALVAPWHLKQASVDIEALQW